MRPDMVWVHVKFVGRMIVVIASLPSFGRRGNLILQENEIASSAFGLLALTFLIDS